MTVNCLLFQDRGATEVLENLSLQNAAGPVRVVELVSSSGNLVPRRGVGLIFPLAGCDDDSTRINVEQIFKLLSAGTEIKSL